MGMTPNTAAVVAELPTMQNPSAVARFCSVVWPRIPRCLMVSRPTTPLSTILWVDAAQGTRTLVRELSLHASAYLNFECLITASTSRSSRTRAWPQTR